MKINFRQWAAAAAVILSGNAVMAQVNVNSTVNAAVKTTANVGHVTNAVNKTTQATVKVVQSTGNVVQHTTSATAKTIQNVNVNTNATANASANSGVNQQAQVSNETNAQAGVEVKNNPADVEKGKSAEVKELVVTEAQNISAKEKELRKEVKPGVFISNNTNGSAHSNVKENNASVTGQTSSNTQANVQTEEVKEKAAGIKTEATQKTKAVVKKAADAKPNGSASVKSSASVEAKQ